MTPEPNVQDETASDSDDSPADGIQGDHADQQECEHHQGSAALSVAVSPCDRNSDNANQKRNGEEHSASLGEPKPVTEPSPIASESRHAGSLGQRNELHLGPACGNVTRRLRRPMINAHQPSLEGECYFQPAEQGAPDDEQRT